MLFLILGLVASSYLPGTNPIAYTQGDSIPLFVSTLDSSTTQLPFDYYYLNFCPSSPSPPLASPSFPSHSDRIPQSPYSITMQEPTSCKLLCTANNSPEAIEKFKWMVDNNYKVLWILDSLPSGYRIVSPQHRTKYNLYQGGFPVGLKSEGHYYIYNHHHIVIKVHKNTKESWSIVGFLVEPLSLRTPSGTTCDHYDFWRLLQMQSTYIEHTILASQLTEDFFVQKSSDFQEIQEVIDFSYSVTFEDSKVRWASRWDVYLYMGAGDFHWVSIVNAFGMILFLALMVAHTVRKIINQDIVNYNEKVDVNPEIDSGWKQLRGEVFRPPRYPGIFSILIGTGIQVILMIFFTLVFACIGYFSPEYRVSLLTYSLFFFAFMGVIGGYSSARLYKLLGGKYWKTLSLGTAILFPGFCFLLFFLINSLIWNEASSGAVDLPSLFEFLCIWFGISLPLVILGSIIGQRRPKLAQTCGISKIPNPFPNSSNKWLYLIAVLSGSLPFGCMFIELNYIMQTLWHHTMFYYLFGFLLFCFILLLVASAEVSILMIYVLINKDEYRWWWMSVTVPGCSGCYLFAYSIFYYLYKLEISRFSSSVLYFGYMLLFSIALALVTGTAGFFGSFIFLRNLYSRIKGE